MLVCVKCGHTWYPIKKHPLRCPSCKVFTWDGRSVTTKKGDKVCTEDGCNRFHYAKGYCQNHYAKHTRQRKLKKCKAHEYCGRLTVNDYCSAHLKRIKEGKSLDLTIKYSNAGKNNPRWNGGISQYKNHYEFKKQRLIKLESTNYKCEDCKNKATVVHHLDETKTNHSLDNLKSLCQKCHMNNYHKDRQGRKRLYGKFSLEEMSARVGCSKTTIRSQAKGIRISHKYGKQINRVLEESRNERM